MIDSKLINNLFKNSSFVAKNNSNILNFNFNNFNNNNNNNNFCSCSSCSFPLESLQQSKFSTKFNIFKSLFKRQKQKKTQNQVKTRNFNDLKYKYETFNTTNTNINTNTYNNINLNKNNNNNNDNNDKKNTKRNFKKSSKSHLPLDGFTIIDFSYLLPGPFTSLILSELGAKVIKIERPGSFGGDPYRKIFPKLKFDQQYLSENNNNNTIEEKNKNKNKKNGDSEENKTSLLYNLINRGKHIINLNLKDENDRKKLFKIMKNEKVDCIIEGFRPGILEKLLGVPQNSNLTANENMKNWIDKNFPGLILTRISPFGQHLYKDDLENLPVHNLNLLALSGFPVSMKFSPLRVAAHSGAFSASLQIVSALLKKTKNKKNIEKIEDKKKEKEENKEKEKEKEAQIIDVSLLDTTIGSILIAASVNNSFLNDPVRSVEERRSKKSAIDDNEFLLEDLIINNKLPEQQKNVKWHAHEYYDYFNHLLSPCYDVYETKEGLLSVGCIELHFWEKFIDILKLNPFYKSDRFAKPKYTQIAINLKYLIEEKLKEKTAVEWEKIFHKHKLPIMKVNKLNQIKNNIQLEKRDMMIKSKTNGGDEVCFIRPGLDYSSFLKNNNEKVEKDEDGLRNLDDFMDFIEVYDYNEQENEEENESEIKN